MQVLPGTIAIICDLSRKQRERSKSMPPQEAMLDEKLRQYNQLLENLDPQVKWELIALMWMGRGEEYQACDFDTLVEESKTHGTQRAGDYLSGKPIHEYLPRAMQKMESGQPTTT